VLASLTAGFLLYLVDLPQKTRLAAEGDPTNGVRLPTDALRELLAQDPRHAWLRRRSFSLYFILSDKYLAPEFHRRVYFFGSLYRIYCDARYLAGVAVAVGAGLALATTAGATGRPDWVGLTPVVLLLVTLAWIGSLGELRHARNSIRKRSQAHATWADTARTTPEATATASDAAGDAAANSEDRPAPPREREGRTRYRDRLIDDLREVALLACFIAIAELIGCLLAAQGGRELRAAGLLMCTGAATLWLMAELGPPSPKDRLSLRGRCLRRLKIKPRAGTQLTPAQRTLLDVALFAPALVAAAAAAQQQGRTIAAVMLWGLICVPATTIMAVRKHEIRLINSYDDQVAWLLLNTNNIDDLARNAARRGAWN
jgi:hypothetical protein